MASNSSSGPAGGGEDTKLVRFVVGKVFDLLIRVLEGKNVLAALAAFSLCFVSWVFLLPKEQRIHADPAALAEGLAHLLGHGVLAAGGWVSALLLLTVGSPMFYLQHKRIRSQGATIIKLRASQQPARVSASDRAALNDYPAQSARRFNLPEPEDPEE